MVSHKVAVGGTRRLLDSVLRARVWQRSDTPSIPRLLVQLPAPSPHIHSQKGKCISIIFETIVPFTKINLTLAFVLINKMHY